MILLLIAGCATQGELRLDDPDERVDRALVRAAAEPITTQGIQVAVLLRGGTDTDFAQQLADLNLLRGDRITDNTIALFVSYDPQYSALRAGSDISPYLPNERLEVLRTTVLNPALRAGDATTAVTLTLAALDADIQANRRLENQFRGWVWILLGLGLLAIFLGPKLLEWLRWGAPGQWAARWWERTPIGREQARRKREQRNAAAQRLCEQVAAEVQQKIAQHAPIAAALTAQLAQLGAQPAVLVHRPADDPALAQAWHDLLRAYNELDRTRERLKHTLSVTESSLREAAQVLAQARRSLGQTSGKQQVVGADVFAELTRIEQAIAALALRHQNTLDAGFDVQALLDALHAVGVASAGMISEIEVIWRRRRPKAFAAQRPPRPRTTLPWRSDSAAPSGSAATASSDTPWNDPGEPGWQSGESKAGGDW
ncbi:MAG: TPM domain-containing protein [Oscillochloris sp.]|nr:TPM domain-containing protein [Oscillochloris sp.]